MNYSFVIPCYKSAVTIKSVVNEIDQSMTTIDGQYEIILVHDASGEDTMNVLTQLSFENNKITYLELSKNFGQHAALMAGYRQSSGEIVISLDDDGQTPADEVFKLINKINEGYDVVFAKYTNKQHTGFRNFGSKINDYMAESLIGKPKSLYISSYFAARKYIIDEVVKYQGSFPYVTGLVLRSTKSIGNVEVNHRAREVGSSNYSLKKLISLWINGFTAFSIKPLRVSMVLGVLCALVGFSVFAYSIANWIINPNVPMGWTSMIAIVSAIGGVILMVLGMIGEYIGRIYLSINNSPQYVVKRKKR